MLNCVVVTVYNSIAISFGILSKIFIFRS